MSFSQNPNWSGLLLEQLSDKLWPVASEQASAALLTGKAGSTLFYGHLYLALGKEQDFERLSQLLEQSISTMSADSFDETLSGGLCGIMWLIRHFCKLGLLEDTITQELASLEDNIVSSLRGDVAAKNYDLLLGLLGKGMYFMEYWPDGESILLLEEIVDQIGSFAIIDEETACWIEQPGAPATVKQEERYNLGMAHGIPGIIAFLSKVYQKNIATDKTKLLLEKAVNWLLKQERPLGKSVFPCYSHSTKESRLAWCYGDLGPALALFHASRALNRKEWREKAIEIALYASLRKIDEAGVWQDETQERFDAGFCHGTAGIAHIFNRFSQVSNQSEFQHAAHYWLTKTVAPLLSENSRGYVYPQAGLSEAVNWCENPTLLNGTAGVGLVLLSFLHKGTSRWDSIFQTDI